MQARLCSHSELTTHSGRQPGGEPKYPTLHEQIGRSPETRHILFGPVREDKALLRSEETVIRTCSSLATYHKVMVHTENSEVHVVLLKYTI